MIEKIDWKQRRSEIGVLQAQSIEEKINRSMTLLEQAINIHKRPALAWSGGKDSTALLHMVLKLKPDIDVIWVNTGVEFPECVQFIRRIKNEWNINLHTAIPEKTFWQTVEEYGWPMLGKGGSGGWESRAAYLERRGKHKIAKATREARISAACCRVLKHKPSEKIYRTLGVDCVMIGNMVSESRQRFFTWAQKGEYYYAVSESRYKLWPLAAWEDDDIWNYHTLKEIPHSSVYDKGHRRNGCWPCLMDYRFPDNKLKILHQSHPKLWKFLIINKDLGKRIMALKLALDIEQDLNRSSGELDKYVAALVNNRPCFFDSL